MNVVTSRLLFVSVFVLPAATLTPVPAQQNAAELPPVTITHGPILGRQGVDSMTVWARTSHPGQFEVRFGTQPANFDQRAVSEPASLADDNTAVCTLTGLESDTEYFYAVTLVGADPKSILSRHRGSFRTLPDSQKLTNAELNPDGLFNFSFEFACGNNQSPEHGVGPTLPAYDTLLRDVRDRIDFAILNGDWLYEDRRDYSADQWRHQVGVAEADQPKVVDVAPAIAGVWENYKAYLSRADNLAEWHRHIPSYYTFDDHEILNDVFGSGTPGYRNRRAVFRDPAIEAWYDYLGWANPVAHDNSIHFGHAKLTAGSDVLVDESASFNGIAWDTAPTLHVLWSTPNAGVKDIPEGDTEGGDPNANVYEVVEVLGPHRLKINPPAVATKVSSYSIGRQSYGTFKVANCRFFLVDTRTNRQLHDINQPDKPGLSMLGLQQRKWLMDWMNRGDADFYFVVSSVNFMVPHVGGGGAGFDANTKDDAWTVFLEERETLIEFWDQLSQPVFVLTGDLHNSFAISITDNVWEFASGPHNSVNHRALEDEGGRPINGRFQYGPRACDIRWSTTAMNDIPRSNRLFPHFCVVRINNVFNNPMEPGGQRLVAFPRPHVVFQYYDGLTGELVYAEAVHAQQP